MIKKTVFVCLVLAFAGLAWAGPADQKAEAILDQYFLIQASLAKDSTGRHFCGCGSKSADDLQPGGESGQSDTRERPEAGSRAVL